MVQGNRCSYCNQSTIYYKLKDQLKSSIKHGFMGSLHQHPIAPNNHNFNTAKYTILKPHLLKSHDLANFICTPNNLKFLKLREAVFWIHPLTTAAATVYKYLRPITIICHIHCHAISLFREMSLTTVNTTQENSVMQVMWAVLNCHSVVKINAW